MPRFVRKMPLYIFIAINLLIIMAMIVCAYSQYLPPQKYPNWSYFGMLFPLPLALNVLFVLFWLTFSWKRVIVPLAGMLICAGSIRTFCPINPSREVPEGCIKVLSYNVFNFQHVNLDTEEKWLQNPILSYVFDCDADIVSLQETTVPHNDIMEGVMRRKYPHQEHFKQSGNHLSFFSKYPILSSKRIEYDSPSNMSCIHEVLVGTDTLVVITNHLQSYALKDADKQQYKDIIKNPEGCNVEQNYESLVSKLVQMNAKRGPQVDVVADVIKQNEGRYIVLCGDFNDVPLSYTHHRLTQQLNDAFTQSGNGFGISYNRHGMFFRIDNILCSPNITPYSATVDDSIDQSDHYPIWAYLKLN